MLILLCVCQVTDLFLYACLLEAEELGLGTCWVGNFGDELIKNLFEIP